MEETPQDSYPEREVFLNDLNKELGSTTSPPLDVLMDQTEKPSNQVSFARRSVNAVVGGIKKVPDVLASSAEYVTQKIDRGPVAKVIDFLEGVPKKYQGKIAEDLKRKIETIKHFYAENSSDEFLRKLAPLSDIMPPEDYQRLMGEANNIIHDEENYNLKAKVNTAFAPDPFSSRTREQEVANTQPPEELPYPAGYNTPEPPPVYVAPSPFPETQPEPPPFPEVVPPPIVESVSPVEPPPFPQEKTPAYGHSVSEIAKLTSPYERDRFDDPEFIKEKESWKTPDRTVVPKVIPVEEKRAEKVEVKEVSGDLVDLISSINTIADRKDNALDLRFLVGKIKKPGVTKEEALKMVEDFYYGPTNNLSEEEFNMLVGKNTNEPVGKIEDQTLPEPPPFYQTPASVEEVEPVLLSDERFYEGLRYIDTFDKLYKYVERVLWESGDIVDPVSGIAHSFYRQDLLDAINLRRQLVGQKREDGKNIDFGDQKLMPRGPLRDKFIELIKENYPDEEIGDAPEPPPVYVESLPFPETKLTKLPPLLEPVDAVIEPRESLEETPLKKELESARAEYVALEAEYKKKVKQGRKWYQKTMLALGAEGKAYPIPEKTPEHKASEEAYFRAKWNLKNSLAGKDIKEIPFEYSTNFIDAPDVGTRKIDVGATKFSEDERRLFQRLVEEASTLPAKERGTVRKVAEKAFLKYSRLSPARRIAVSTTLIMGGSFLTGGIALGAVAGAGAIRAAKGLAGLGAAGVVGGAFDGIKRKKQEKISKERQDQYGEEIAQIAEIDKNDPRAYAMFRALEDKQIELDEKEAQQDKRDRLLKAALMATTGGVAALATGAVIDNVAPSGTGASALDKAKGNVASSENVSTTKKPGFLDKLLRKNPETQASTPAVETPRVSAAPEAPQTPKVVETPPVALNIEGKINVPLSSKGYIATIAELQNQLKGKTLPPGLTELLKEPPEKIAIKLGLYKPDQVAESALGFKGEQLTLDTEGNISLMHNDASVDTLVKSDGTISEYKGNMFDADGVSPIAEVAKPGVEKPIAFNEMGTVDTVPVESGDAPVESPVTAEVEKVPTPVALDSREYALLSPEYKGPDAIVLGLAPIRGEYQFGKEYQVQRNAYSRFIRRELMNLAPGTVDSMFAVPYQGGMIDIFQKGNDITMLLNGEKIGTASLFPDGKIGFQYESKLGKGLLGVKSEYEQAFDFAKGEVEKNKKFFKVSK